MKVEKDYEEYLIVKQKQCKILYCIIGVFALAVHAKPRWKNKIFPTLLVTTSMSKNNLYT